ncbi:MAG: ATP-binding protein [Nanoarchaeota archaeon]|nr:ATP-binding protein [Nanoarchaeota archaeon]
MARQRFDRTKLKSETAMRLYDSIFGTKGNIVPAEDDGDARKRMMREKKLAFDLLRMERGPQAIVEEKDGSLFPSGNGSRNGFGNDFGNHPINGGYVPSLEEVAEVSKEIDLNETQVPEPISIPVTGASEPEETSVPVKGKKKGFLANLDKQYTGDAGSAGDSTDISNVTVPVASDVSDDQDAGQLSTGITTKIPSFARTGQSAITSKVPQISLEQYLAYFEDYGVVGEEKNLLRFSFRLSQLKPTFVDGKAGSGKTYIIKAGLSLLPKDYVLSVDCASDTSLFIDDDVEKYPIIWFKEFQKVAYKTGGNNQLLEMIKSWAEGEDARRRVNDHGKLKFQTISEKCVISCLATENAKKSKFDKDKETLRRFDILHTDESPEHIQAVLEYKANQRSMTAQKKKLSKFQEDQVKRHFKELVDLAQDKDNPIMVCDPFGDIVKEYIPETPRAMAYVDMYYDYVDGCAKFHHKNRLGEDNLILVDLEDQYIVYQIYHKDFCDTLKKLDNLSDEGFDKCAKKSKEQVDWTKMFEKGYEVVKERFSEEVAEEWVARQLVNNKITVWDPLTKTDVVIVDYNNPTSHPLKQASYDPAVQQSDPNDSDDPVQGPQYSPPQITPVHSGADIAAEAYTPDVPGEDEIEVEIEEEIETQPVEEISLE